MLDTVYAAKIVSYAVAVGLLWPAAQAALQKPWLNAKWKSWLSLAAAVVFGLAGYVTTSGFDFSDPSKIVLWVIGLYGAIQVLYRALKASIYIPLESSVTGVIGGDEFAPDAEPEQ